MHTARAKSSVLVLVLLSFVPAARAQTGKDADVRAAFIVDSTQADPATAEAAAKPFFDEIVKKIKLSYSIIANISHTELQEKMKSGRVNVAFGSALQYTKLTEHLELVPISITMPFGKKHFTLLLLTRRDAGITRLAGLKGKSITYSTEDINQVYLAVLLRRNGAKDPHAFFGKINEKKNRKAPVMDLLLRETDACLVSNDLFNAMAALNPQLKSQLGIVVESKPFAQNTMFARADTPKHLISAVKRTSFELHDTSAGRQILLIFRIKRLARPDRADFDTIRELWKEYTKLVPQKK
jgi:ABC-type phosphate/phosphonate transport system substrate-binding protein